MNLRGGGAGLINGMGITTAVESRLNGLSDMQKVAKWACQALRNDEKVCIRLQIRKKF